MKVLHVVASLSPEWGGPAAVVRHVVRALIRRGVSACIYAASRRDEFEPAYADGLEATFFAQDSLARLWTAHSRDLARAIRRHVGEFDVVHTHEIWHHPHVAASRAARSAQVPYVVTPHGALDPWALGHKAWKKRLFMAYPERRILREAAALHALTVSEARILQRLCPKARVTVIPNGVDAEEFRSLPPRQQFERHYPTLEGKQVILFLSRLHPKKGLDLLARAFGRIAGVHRDARLVVAGSGPASYEARVRRMFGAAGVLEKTIFTGALMGQAKLESLARADLFVLPSYSEGFSVAVLEALACGVPVVITRPCHFPEVADVHAGEVVEPSVDQLVAALDRLLASPSLRIQMGASGRHLVAARHMWSRVADQMIDLYQAVVAAAPRVPA